MFGFLLFYSLIHLFFDNAGMESGECSRMIGRCTEHFFCRNRRNKNYLRLHSRKLMMNL